MSAWMISNRHADFLATAYVQFIDASAHPQEIGQQLLYENCASLAARYGNNETWQADQYRYRPWRAPIDPANVNKQARCADYQCCEHAEWEFSESALRLDALIDATGGRDCELSREYPWGIDEHAERVARTPVACIGPSALLAQLRAASPMRPVAGRTADVDGLPMFDAYRQPRLL